MKAKSISYGFIFLLIPFAAKTQLTENFSDGDFSINPQWVGNTASWIINPAYQLQSNNLVANSSFYLSTVSTLAQSAQWEFTVNLRFATSGANYADVYVISSSSDLSAVSTSGYFIRIGNTADEISLYRKDAGVAGSTKIIDGTDGVLSSSSNNIARIKLVRDASNQWTLFSDITGTGNAYVSEGTITDVTYSTAAYFGILVKQSSIAGFAQKHFFDEIEVKPFIPDTTPPLILAATVLSANTLDLLMNEPLEPASSQSFANYSADNGLDNPINVFLDSLNPALVHLSFVGNFKSGLYYQLSVNGVKDLAGNPVVNGKASFIYFAPYTARRYDVVIDEIMADPSPPVGLPGNEWIGLKNTSAAAINLLGWKIGDAGGLSGPVPDFILLPDSFVILCSATSRPAMSLFGKALSVPGFPLLDNVSGLLYLKSPQNNTIHSVNYSSEWYRNELKKKGGWTLEMIDTHNPCSGFSNWAASTDKRGGTPGTKNSVDGINADKNAPRLLRAYTTDSVTVILVFDEPLDSTTATKTNNFNVSGGIGNPVSVVVTAPFFDRIALK
ncbi:MAG: lamin tail domain-containing protein, partial [Ferruginibacter sp.]